MPFRHATESTALGWVPKDTLREIKMRRHSGFFTRWAGALTLLIVVFAVGAFAAAMPAGAQSPARNIAVYGDSLADGVWDAFTRTLKREPGGWVATRRSSIGTGLTRPDFSAWLDQIDADFDANPARHVVVMFGLNDLRDFRDDRRGRVYGTDAWNAAYAKRVDQLIARLRTKADNVVWIGLPVFRKPERNDGAKHLTSLYAEAAARARIAFVPIYDDFLGPEGEFTTHLAVADGRRLQVRGDDGLHFIGTGYDIIATKAMAAIRRFEAGQAEASARLPDTVSPR
jgi:hypothetical protein